MVKCVSTESGKKSKHNAHLVIDRLLVGGADVDILGGLRVAIDHDRQAVVVLVVRQDQVQEDGDQHAEGQAIAEDELDGIPASRHVSVREAAQRDMMRRAN